MSFVYGVNAISVGDPARDDAEIRKLVPKLLDCANALSVGPRRDRERTARWRSRIAFMRFVQLLCDGRFDEWVDMNRLKSDVAEGRSRSFESDAQPGLEHFGRVMQLVDCHMICMAYDGLPEGLRLGLAKVKKTNLDALVVAWGNVRGGAKRAGEGVTKYETLARVLRAAVGDRTRAATLKDEWMQFRTGGR